MKTTLREIKNAYEALQQMRINGLISYNELRKINKLKKALSDEMDSASNVQLQIMNENNGHIEVNSIKFDNQADFIRYSEEWEHISSEEFELECEKIDLRRSSEIIYFESLVDTSALEKMIDFGDD